MYYIRQSVAAWMLYILTTFWCGTAAWAVWAVGRKLFSGRSAEGDFCVAGRLAQWLYVLPLVQAGWAIYARVVTEFELSFGRTTRAIERVLLALAAVWLVGFLWAVGKWMSAVFRRRRIGRACIQCTGQQAELFRRACWRNGIAGEIRLYQGEGVETPFFQGTFFRRLYLPAGDIPQEELQEILRQCLWYRRCAAAVEGFGCLIHWYNPLVKGLRRKMAETDGNREQERKGRIGVRVVCTILVLAIQLTCTGFCAVQFLKGYTWLEICTSDVVEEIGEVSEPPKEYVTNEEESGIEVEDDVVEIDETDGSYDADWYISPRVRKQSPVICGEAGEEITVVGMCTEGVPVKCGILYEDGTRQYVEEEEGICATFALRQSGYFRFFVQNDGDVRMECTAIIHKREAS